MPTIDQLKQSRLDKLNKLLQKGINPYPASVKRNQTIAEARIAEEKEVIITGRIIGLRGHGKLIFGDIVDETGKIQIVFKKDLLSETTFSLVELIDRGDFLEISGKVSKTVSGEITIFINDFRIITKTLQPLPDNWYGFKDVEERYRKRYLDIILNPEVHKRITMRGKIIQEIRNFLTKENFIEVETPTLQPIYGGGFAKPFKTFYNALETDFYLRISDEMYLKRLIVGGFEKVFEITKVFRNEGYDFDHNPEFTMFEAQIAYQDYRYGMDLIEKIIENVAVSILGSTKFNYQETKMDVKRPWTRLTMVDAIRKHTGINPLKWESVKDAKSSIDKLEIRKEKIHELNRINSIGELIAFVFEEKVEEKLINPTIIYDYPIEISPLAKKCADPHFTQRFEMFAFGSELGNNYTELNDPIDLRKRFVDEKKREEGGFEEAHQTDYDYLEAIEHGFPPTCGIAIGIDRLVMLLTDAKSIKDIIAFPTLRPLIRK